MRRNPPPGRGQGENATGIAGGRSGDDSRRVVAALTACGVGTCGADDNQCQAGHIFAIQERAVCENPLAGPDGAGVRGDGKAYTLEARTVPQAIAFSCKDYAADAGDLSPTLRAMGHAGSHANAGGQVAIATRSTVRRLTPRECERLQGFPADWTLVSYRGKPAADGPRYKAIGNSMAVPVMRWIGSRLAEVENRA